MIMWLVRCQLMMHCLISHIQQASNQLVQVVCKDMRL